MVTVRVSETYDLSTKVNKMGLVGIHTPTGQLVNKLWSGLVLQHKKFRFVKCDVAMACASMLPADPLQIGVSAGDIAPQDMFNPILYKAVSNQSMNQFLAWLNVVGDASGLTGAFDKNSIVDINDPSFPTGSGDAEYDQFNMYYALLSDSDGWRKAMPQAGLTMRGLVPLVFQVVSQYGTGPQNGNDEFDNNIGAPPLDAASVNSNPTSNNTGASAIAPRSMRGPSMRMPAIDTSYFAEQAFFDTSVVPGGPIANIQTSTPHVPPAYVGMIVLPPAKLNQLYYRLKVTWTIEFIGLRSNTDIANWFTLNDIGNTAYGTDYSVQSQAMAATLGMADASGADITKIMEGAA